MSNINLHTCDKAAPGWNAPGECKECEREKRHRKIMNEFSELVSPPAFFGVEIKQVPDGTFPPDVIGMLLTRDVNDPNFDPKKHCAVLKRDDKPDAPAEPSNDQAEPHGPADKDEMTSDDTICGSQAAIQKEQAMLCSSALLDAVNEAIDAMVITQRLFDLSDGHILMQRCRALIDNVWIAERLIQLEKARVEASNRLISKP